MTIVVLEECERLDLRASRKGGRVTKLLQRRQTLHRQLQEQQIVNSRMQERIEKLEALANLGMASAMIAHEMNNILTPLGNYALLAMNHPDDKSLINKTLTKTANNTQRAARILDAMMSIAKGDRQEACAISRETASGWT